MLNMSTTQNNKSLTILIPQGQDRSVYGAVCSLGRAGHQIVLALPPLHQAPPVVRSRYVAEVVESPDPLKEFDAFKAWLSAYQSTHPEVLVFPINEAVVQAAIDLRAEQGNADAYILPSERHLRCTLSKYYANQAALSAELRVPETLFLREPGSVEYAEIPEQQSFPCLVKWDNCKASDGTYLKGDNRIVANRDSLVEILAELRPCNCGVILQELVPGCGVGAFFFRHEGKMILSFTHRRMHEVPWTGGVSSLCIASCDSKLLALGERLLESLDYEGVAMVEFRQDADNEPHFIEINGRLWGSLTLALKAGVNFPLAMLECFTCGQTAVEQPDLSKRITWRHLPTELAHIYSVFSERSSALAQVPSRAGALLSLAWHSVAPTKSDLFWWDDPIPGLESYKRLIRGELSKIKCFLIGVYRRRCSTEFKQLREVQAKSQRVLESLKTKPVNTILFLCYGNICRSSYAEFRWNDLRLERPDLPSCASAGFHEKVGRRTPARFSSAARSRNIDLSPHRSKRVSEEMLETSDLVVLMDMRNWNHLKSEFAETIEKTIFLGACNPNGDFQIADPYGQPIPAGSVAYHQIDEALVALAQQLS